MAAHEISFGTFNGGTYADLAPFQYGRELCEPGHAFGPARRSHFLFHYVVSGSGTLIANDEGGEKSRYRLGAGEGFLIFPGQVNTYFADMEDPWEYIWVEFDGMRAAEAIQKIGLTTAAPIYRAADRELAAAMEAEMRFLVDHRDDSPLTLVAHTYLFLDYLVRSIEPAVPVANRLQDFYIRTAVEFIERNYQNDITVEDIARQTGLNRSYFGKLFKGVLDKSPQQYLISYRMHKAAELLKLTALSVRDVGCAVGYPNQLHFSRAFRNAYGVSPRAWRQSNLS